MKENPNIYVVMDYKVGIIAGMFYEEPAARRFLEGLTKNEDRPLRYNVERHKPL